MPPPSLNQWNIPFLSGADIRQSYIDFFRVRAHQFIPSSPVVPHDDPTLLFINSGMNQFKSIFLGDMREGLKRAVNSQKCLRVSGKHNDLDEVGRDTYHHTFFEMLGNWSFGDYYKKEALTWAWELLTEVWKLPKQRLFVTIYNDDDEAFEIWKDLGVEEKRIMRFGEKSNFWEMGDVGPCGPCSEMHFDMGDLATQEATFADPISGVNGTNARYIEIWNNVFMQYERMQDGSLKPLKSKHVDTGMGLERICSIIQGSGSNYETDIFQPIITEIASLTGVPYNQGEAGTPHRVIADHLRALSFAIADGATPGNEGRGYVLRRILRRASRFSQQLQQKKPFIYKLVPKLAEVMGHAFPELVQRQDYITQVIEAEEERFMRTLKDGLSRFAKVAADVKNKKGSEIAGSEAFVLYDTYGFPVDLTGVLAEEAGLRVDFKGFEICMAEQRDRARSAAKFDASIAGEEGWHILGKGETKFDGYSVTSCDTETTRYREVGDDILICLKTTPFYAESGGQVGDTGTLTSLDKANPIELRVVDTFKILDMHVHKCNLITGLVNARSLAKLHAAVDVEKRMATVRNHSATHLLHAALRQVLGPHVQQQGSRVAPEGLRFDFTHPKGLSSEELQTIETIVNEQILADEPILTKERDLEEAKKLGAMALFGEKYGERVRTIQMGDFSFELCGGTHARATGQIGLLIITGETSIASGIRRIEAITGLEALRHVRQQATILNDLSKNLKVKPEAVQDKIHELGEKLKVYDKELKALRQEQINNHVEEMLSSTAEKIAGTLCIVKKIDASIFPKETHQLLMDSLAGKLKNGVAFLTHVEDGALSLLAVVGQDAKAKVKAGDLMKELSEVAGGRGGGRPDRAQAGSKFPEKEPQVLAAARKLLNQTLGA
jgi:alanyl-tRNA synthetase